MLRFNPVHDRIEKIFWIFHDQKAFQKIHLNFNK